MKTTFNGCPERNNHRLLKKYDRQIESLKKTSAFLAVGMSQQDFWEQSEVLRLKLAMLENPPVGEITVVTCLPSGSLRSRLKRTYCGEQNCLCACRPGRLEGTESPKTLYALLGVRDGRSTRLNREQKSDAHFARIEAMVSPNEPLTASAGIDLMTLYQNISRQHGILTSATANRNGMSTAIWLEQGRLILDCADSEHFRKAPCREWGVPSFSLMIAL